MRKALIAIATALLSTISMAAVDVNKASEADLDSIKGIGPSTSARILQERQSAPFKNWTDFIERMPSVAEKRAAQLSAAGLTVNGEAFKPAMMPKEKASTTPPASR